MRWDEKCIIPGCDRAGAVGAKPIYIRLTVGGKRILKKVGALCEEHLPPELLIEDYDFEKDWLPSAKDESKRIMSWLVSCPADDVNFIGNLQKASLPLLRRVLERLEDELRRGLPHKTRIKKVTARIRALEKELLKEDAENDYGSSVVDQVLPQKKKQLSVGDGALIGHSEEDTVYPKNGPSMAKWREISELGKKILPGTEKVRCHRCEADIIPDKDELGNAWCPGCKARVNPKMDKVVK